MTFYSSKAKKGFTLIELLVVIAIIGILASIISVSLVSARAKGRDAKRVSDIRSIQLALESYYNDNGYYPLSLTNTIAPTYISTVPVDPTDNSTPYKYTSYNLLSQSNTLCTTYKPVAYHLGAAMESNETNNPSLNQDSTVFDSGVPATLSRCNVSGTSADFNGKATACVGTTAGTFDTCFDMTN